MPLRSERTSGGEESWSSVCEFVQIIDCRAVLRQSIVPKTLKTAFFNFKYWFFLAELLLLQTFLDLHLQLSLCVSNKLSDLELLFSTVRGCCHGLLWHYFFNNWPERALKWKDFSRHFFSQFSCSDVFQLELFGYQNWYVMQVLDIFQNRFNWLTCLFIHVWVSLSSGVIYLWVSVISSLPATLKLGFFPITIRSACGSLKCFRRTTQKSIFINLWFENTR